MFSAFRNVAVHPADINLLGMKWRDNYYVDLVLPFGLGSAPCIFDSIASIVEWILRHNYDVSNLLHYLDDFIIAGSPGASICCRNLATAMNVCSYLGLPLHTDKCEGPATLLVILDIDLGSVNQVARLPDIKLTKLRALVDSYWSYHATKVVWPGRNFIRRMINLLCCFMIMRTPVALMLNSLGS